MRNLQEGIALHTIPFYGDDRPESKKRRKRWVDFVKLKRAKWEPSGAIQDFGDLLKTF